MPRYYKDHPRGYDLDLEAPFIEIDGKRYAVGSVGSFIWGCPKCGEQHFREPTPWLLNRPEHCFTCPDGQVMEPIPLEEKATRYYGKWELKGDRITTYDERKMLRLIDEIKRPWIWQFGQMTEADFPLGYAKECPTPNP